MQQLITIRKGSLLSVKVQNADDTVTVMTEDEQKKNKYSADETLIVQIPTVDFELGQYYVVTESAKGDLLDIQPFKVIGLFEKESRKDTLKQQIDLLDKVISAKLSESEGVLQNSRCWWIHYVSNSTRKLPKNNAKTEKRRLSKLN